MGTRINDRWAADLIDYTTKPSRGKDDPPSQEPYQYILIVQDVFSRKVWAVSMRVKTPEFVQQAFEHIVRSGAGVPRELDTDDGAEFKGPFEAYLKEEQIQHSIADPRNKNARGMLDAAIRAFKQQLARIQVAEHTRDWASLVTRAAKAYNDSEHSALIGRAPDDVSEDEDVQFLLKKQAAENLQTNEQTLRIGAQSYSDSVDFAWNCPTRVVDSRGISSPATPTKCIPSLVLLGALLRQLGAEVTQRDMCLLCLLLRKL